MENRLNLLLDSLNQTRQEIIRLKDPKNIKKHSSPGKLSFLGMKLKTTIERIANFGTKYSVVVVYLKDTAYANSIPVNYTKVYYSDITLEDAEEYVKTMLANKEGNTHEFVKAEYLNLGLNNLFA